MPGTTSPDHLVASVYWEQDRPVPMPAGTERLILVLESLRGLSAVRRQVRAFLTAGCAPGSAEACEDAVERAIFAIDELTSNALRHGLPPSSLQVWDEERRWVVIVTDSAPQRMPAPAVGRPAGAGGYGLYVIADLTADHGVHYEPDRKLIWACLSKPASRGSGG